MYGSKPTRRECGSTAYCCFTAALLLLYCSKPTYICSKPTRRSWEKYTKILFDSVTKKKVEHTARICEFADPFFFSLRPHSF